MWLQFDKTLIFVPLQFRKQCKPYGMDLLVPEHKHFDERRDHDAIYKMFLSNFKLKLQKDISGIHN